MTRLFFIGTAVAVALFLGWSAWDGWLYLQRGYSLGVSMPGRSVSVFHIGFPVWRAAVHVLLWVAAMASIAAYAAGRPWASKAAWLIFMATLAVAVGDVMRYGTLGSPTSIWTLLLLLLFALLTSFRPLTLKDSP